MPRASYLSIAATYSFSSPQLPALVETFARSGAEIAEVMQVVFLLCDLRASARHFFPSFVLRLVTAYRIAALRSAFSPPQQISPGALRVDSAETIAIGREQDYRDGQFRSPFYGISTTQTPANFHFALFIFHLAL